MLHLLLEDDAERVVAGEVCGLAHQEEPVRGLGRDQQLLCAVAEDLPVEPDGIGIGSGRGKGRGGEGSNADQ